MSKIAKDVGICSENLVSISESLISISEKVATVAKVIAEIVSEFQVEQDKPAVETKSMKAAPKQIEAKEKKPMPVKEYTFTFLSFEDAVYRSIRTFCPHFRIVFLLS